MVFLRTQLQFSIILALLLTSSLWGQSKEKPVRIAIAGLVHDHVHGILSQANNDDIEIVGISEPNRVLAKRYSEQYGFSMDMVYDNLDKLLDETKPAAVAAFNSIYGHLSVVEACAPRGIHVMVEKPLAVSLEHAERIESLAKENGIMVLTNYETTWYGSNQEAYRQIHKRDTIGEIRKVVVHDGHRGPAEIGVSSEFLEWLTDPRLNGGGAIIDFGCYGANLMTWLMKGEVPISVMAVTQQIKPDKYPKVDDEATLVLTYPKAQGIIQASWNWPYNRKDIEIYGTKGRILCPNPSSIDVKIGDNPSTQAQVEPPTYPNNNPFSLLASLLRSDTSLEKFDLNSLENNLIVVQILDAGVRSAKTGERIYLNAEQNK